MSGRARQEQPEQQGGGNLPPGMGPIVFDGFETMNTLAARPSIEDEHCSWMDTFMPVGKSTARTMPGVGTAIWATPAGIPIVFFAFASVYDTPYCLAFLATGDIWAINTTTLAASLIASGVISSPAQSTIGVSQWGDQYIIIIASGQTSGNGMFFWDGVTFYMPCDAV